MQNSAVLFLVQDVHLLTRALLDIISTVNCVGSKTKLLGFATSAFTLSSLWLYFPSKSL